MEAGDLLDQQPSGKEVVIKLDYHVLQNPNLIRQFVMFVENLPCIVRISWGSVNSIEQMP